MPEYLLCAAWCIGVLLAQVHLFAVQTTWSAEVWLVMAAVPLSFIAGARLGRALLPVSAAPREPKREHVDVARTRKLLYALLALGLAEVLHQYLVAGGVPLISANIDEARTALPGGPTVALVNCLHVAAIVAIVTPARLLVRAALPELAVASVALVTLASFGGRGTVLAPVAVAFGARWLVRARPRTSVVIAGAALLAALGSLMFFVRTVQPPLVAFESELYGSVVDDTPAPLRPLIPLHIALAMNFEALARVVEHFPDAQPFGRGAFNARALEFVVPGTRDISEVSSRLTPPWVVSTMAGPLWADGGLPAVVLGVLLVGCAAAAAQQLWRRARDLRTALLYSYVLYLALFGVYQNFWTQYIDWVLVAPLLYIAGAIVVSGAAKPAAAGPGNRPPPASARRSRAVAALPAQVRRLATRHGLAAAIAGVAAAIAVAATLVAGEGVQSAQRASASPLPFALVKLRPDLASDAVLVADSDAAGPDTPLYAVAGSGSTRHLTRLERTASDEFTARPATSVSAGRPPRPTFDVAGWKTTKTALFTLWHQAATTFVRVDDIHAAGRPLARHAARTGAIADGYARKLAIATWSGEQPDLFVIDYAAAATRLRIRVFSGESGFRSEIFSSRPPPLGVTARDWSIDVGRASGERPDVLLVKRSATIKRLEFHVLRGDAGFDRFVLQRASRARAPVPDGERFMLVHALGSPAVAEHTGRRALRITLLRALRAPA